MAYKDSGEIANNSNYALGDYSFRIERTSVPGSTNDKIEAICTDKDGKNARKSIQVPSSTKFDGWYVEANEDTASVYAVLEVPTGDGGKTSDLDVSPLTVPIPSPSSPVYAMLESDIVKTEEYYYCPGGAHRAATASYEVLLCAAERLTYTIKWKKTYKPDHRYDEETETQSQLYSSWEYNGKTVWYTSIGASMTGGINAAVSPEMGASPIYNAKEVAWTMVYGTTVPSDFEKKELLLGRFAIEIEDAGGVGPGGGTDGGWTDPEDYDEDWEEGDPTHTLYVTVTGALSGRHNDPIVDPSYSYIPADKDTVKGYGCGGDGGHGGGGGAGASTVVIHKFATNQANSKEVTAIAIRHGYGSGGGKGGKGGDGCILVYY